MTPEKILELAAENQTDTFSERVWAFDEEALLVFARAIVDAGQDATTIKIPASVFVKIVKDVNTVKDLLIAMKAAEEEE